MRHLLRAFRLNHNRKLAARCMRRYFKMKATLEERNQMLARASTRLTDTINDAKPRVLQSASSAELLQELLTREGISHG